MVKKTLVTTAIESTWPENKDNIIFLGSWGLPYIKKNTLSPLNFEVVPYHWDDRKKLKKDYIDLEIIYESYLSYISDELNKIHKTNFTKRFWRIFIGPWLYTSIQVLFDRWSMLKIVTSKYGNLNINLIENNKTNIGTIDLDSFNLAIESDHWNEAIYGTLIKNFFYKKMEITFKKESSREKKKKIRNRQFFIKGIILFLTNMFSRVFSKNSDVFIISSHLSFKNLILLQLKLKQFPSVWSKKSRKYKFKDFDELRKKYIFSFNQNLNPEFEAILNIMLIKIMPRVYLEGFKHLPSMINKNGWPESPKTIFTSNSYSSDEQFKFWAATKVEKGAKLIIGQHGGNFGMTQMAIHESHQIKISDKWLSWGWKDKNNSKVLPIGNFKFKFKNIKRDPKGDALLVGMTLPRFSYYLYSTPIASQMENYFNNQFELVESLPLSIQKKIRVRLYKEDRGWFQKERWKSKKYPVSFDNTNISLLDSMKKSRLFIGTYNATTYLETFSANIPSIIFWNPKHWELNKEAMEDFKKLKKVGIFYESPIEAAKHIEQIWEEIDEWWFQDKIQKALNEFNEKYSRNNKFILENISDELNNKRRK